MPDKWQIWKQYYLEQLFGFKPQILQAPENYFFYDIGFEAWLSEQLCVEPTLSQCMIWYSQKDELKEKSLIPDNLQEYFKTVEYKDDSKTQVMILNNPINIIHSNCAVYTDPYHKLIFRI